ARSSGDADHARRRAGSGADDPGSIRGLAHAVAQGARRRGWDASNDKRCLLLRKYFINHLWVFTDATHFDS
ncbi:MAG TPA: hypothetical protein VH328_04820, partial [Burkholderiaceae bacterium]|nr:hypothetical protein [Burkholderiaceae bacterium]